MRRVLGMIYLIRSYIDFYLIICIVIVFQSYKWLKNIIILKIMGKF